MRRVGSSQLIEQRLDLVQRQRLGHSHVSLPLLLYHLAGRAQPCLELGGIRVRPRFRRQAHPRSPPAPPADAVQLGRSDNASNLGAIIGGVVGGLALLGFLIGFALWRKRRGQRDTSSFDAWLDHRTAAARPSSAQSQYTIQTDSHASLFPSTVAQASTRDTITSSDMSQPADFGDTGVRFLLTRPASASSGSTVGKAV